MRKKKERQPDDPEQYERFVKTAENHFGDDAEEKFEEAMRHILDKKLQGQKETPDT